MFATDSDLLPLEPNLFRDVMWVSQRLVDGQATVSGSVLTMTTADTALDAAGLEAGHVVYIGGLTLEVLERLSSTTLRVSRPRTGPSAAQIPVPNIDSPAAARIATFAPQRAVVHTQLLSMLGIEPGDAITENDITNPAALRRCECLGTLHLIYAAAGALSPKDSITNQRADYYRSRFAQERERASASIDTNGDGQPDAIRTLNVFQLIRS